MTDDLVPFDLLSAYVDGELSPQEAARVARQVATDPELAGQLATLQELRAQVAGLAPDVVMLPQYNAVLPPRGARLSRLRSLAAAISLIAVLAGGLFWAAGQRPADEADSSRVIARLIESHDAWRGNGGDRLLPVGIASPRTMAMMAATGLSLVHEEVLQVGPGIDVRHSGYLGANGCRVSLFELPAVAQAPDGQGILELGQGAELLSASWQVGATRFVMIARKMDAVRFATIASSIRSAMDAHHTDESDLMAALEGARQRCLA